MADWRSGKFAGRLLVAAIAAFGIALVSGLPPESGRAQAQTGDAKSCERIVGVWTWIVNGDVTFNPDGTLVQGKITGRWFCDSNRGQIVIVWSHGFTDIVSMSDDGTRMSGTSNVGGKVSGQRKTAAAKPDLGANCDLIDPRFREFFGDRCQPPSSPPPGRRVLGLELAPLSDDLRQRFRISNTVSSGLVVLGVDAGSPASDRRLDPGDVILEINQEPVSRVDAFQATLERLRTEGRRSILLKLSNAEGELRFVAVPLTGAASPSPPPSSSPPPQVGQKPAPTPSTQAGEWTTGWSRMELTATLRPHSEDAKRGMLGIRIGSPDALISLLVPTLKQGTLVVNVTSDSAVSGLMQQGDIVTAIDGRSVRNATHLTSLVGRNPPGARIKMEFWRWSGGYPELLAAIYRSAEANDPTATHILGALETLSAVEKPDYARAFAFYLRAAHLGSVHGMVAAANAYKFGSGADKNPSEAAQWYRQAIELGSASAMFGLGALIASGQIGDVDRAEVFRLMERAAKAGHVMANYTIASYYSAGYGAARNPDAGARHLIEAIRNGGAEMLAQFSTEKSWQPGAEFYSALQRQLREAKVYRGPTDGKMNPQILAALTRLVESAP